MNEDVGCEPSIPSGLIAYCFVAKFAADGGRRLGKMPEPLGCKAIEIRLLLLPHTFYP
ncbi:hypothetical protein [Methylomonas albis]|nr:hypothetical protein [Methylomonas albis]